ncbi:aromatic ring-hydroxylating dioxygenase subunit alpha [soil metagenome]
MRALNVIDEDSLRACLGSFPEASRTLPRDAYLAEEVLRWEMANFYAASWVCVGRSAELADPGDQRAGRIGDEGILLARGQDGRLRGFFNTCRHRGHELLSCDAPIVNNNVVRCPYHRWMYALDGSFTGGPGMGGTPGFDRDDPAHGLLPARVDEWGGWAFVNVSSEAADLAEHIGDFDDLVSDYELERLVFGAGHSYEVKANWKIIIENYHECYHCSEIHPELCRVSSPSSGDNYEPTGTVIGGSMELLPGAATMSLDGSSLGVPFRKLNGSQLRDVYYAELFPNLLLSIHPDYVMTHRLEPLGPGATRVECQWLFPPEAYERADFDPSYASEFWDVTNKQDWAACESVQRGVAGAGYRQAPFSRDEWVVHLSMAMVARGYLEGEVRPLRSSRA